jgi:hypothetical protein
MNQEDLELFFKEQNTALSQELTAKVQGDPEIVGESLAKLSSYI